MMPIFHQESTQIMIALLLVQYGIYFSQFAALTCTVDMMALPSNVMKAQNGCNLKFFSPLPFNESSGVNVFAQDLSSQENYYAFPPFLLISSLLNFLLSSQAISVTMIVQDLSPRKCWWPILISYALIISRLDLKANVTSFFFPLTPNIGNIHDLYLGTLCF